ncbi:hypothetical protein [Actinorhabdospora filicis]|uniref:hypothetical protein n=1 Tax=Actinorhabdospora filicis TaxID=1785913 RepID=UPI00255221D7|nr:hypothetical protein [Actinorhabdospora filicis]
MTIKFGAGTAPWWTVRGGEAEVKEGIVAGIGFDPAQYRGVPLAKVIADAGIAVLAADRIAAAFDAQPITPPGDDPGPRAGIAGAPESPNLRAAIEAARSRAELRSLYTQHTAAFTADPELLAAWRRKGATLPD